MTQPPADRPDIAFFPPIGFLLATVATVLLEWLLPLPLLPDRFHLASALLGAVFLGVTIWLESAALRRFRDAGTNVNPRQPALSVVRGGPYRFTRNPMYLGMVLFQLALAFGLSLDWGIPVALILLAALHFGVVLREEAYLTAKFGDEYRALLKTTRRWL